VGPVESLGNSKNPIDVTVLRRTPSAERDSPVAILGAFCDLFVDVSSFADGRHTRSGTLPPF